MARSRIRASNSVTLFPFLAVLMCAMGALILLLIVIIRRVRHQPPVRAAIVAPEMIDVPPVVPAVVPTLPALHAVVPSPAETDRMMAAVIAEVDKTDARRRNELQRLRDAYATLTVEQQRLVQRLAAGERKLKATQAKLRNLQDARAALGTKSAAEARAAAQLETDIRGQVAALDGVRRNLQALKLQKAQTSTKFAIVPFDGQSGTTRRPIFIECTKDALRILPEGVVIKAEQLTGFSSYRNPVLAGARTLIQYWVAKSHINSSKEPKPYVLLLVRPGGSVAYYAARKMLRSLGDPIGYELIEDDWELKLPAVDPGAKAVCEAAVNRVLKTQPANAGSLLAGRGTGSGSFGSPRSGGDTGRRMRFNRATGRFETIEPNTRNLLGPFGEALTERRGAGNAGGVQPDGVGRGRGPSTQFRVPGSRRDATGRNSRPGRRVADADGSENTARGAANAGGPELKAQGSGTGRQSSTGKQPSGHPAGTADGRGGGNGPGQQTDDRLWPLKRGAGRGSARDPGGAAGSSRAGRTGDSHTQRPGGEPSASTAATPPSSGSPHGNGISAFGVQRGRSRSQSSQWQPRRRWGLSNPGATIGFEKEVRVWASADQLLVGRQRIAVGNGETREQLLQNVVVAIAREVRAWGKPPASFYWVPRVKFVISPGGNQHYGRLRKSLHKMGLQTIAEYRLETREEPGVRRQGAGIRR